MDPNAEGGEMPQGGLITTHRRGEVGKVDRSGPGRRILVKRKAGRN